MADTYGRLWEGEQVNGCGREPIPGVGDRSGTGTAPAPQAKFR
jgi:hypothetical protein